MNHRSLQAVGRYSLLVALCSALGVADAFARQGGPIVIPEPSTMVLIGVSASALGARRWWRNRRQRARAAGAPRH